MLVLLLVPFASAYADITFDFNVDDVQGYAYNCLDAECSQVKAFGGNFIGGSSSDDGQVTVRFPSTLQDDGYALYFVSEGYVPLEGKFIYHTYGSNGYSTATLHAEFYKLDSCQAIIDDFSLVNEVYANEPLAVNLSSRADAVVTSAFSEAGEVDFVPPQLKDRYYSSDVAVGYEVYDVNGLVHSDEVLFTEATGNPLFADEKGDVHFIWTPVTEGDYDVVAYTQVIDNQCASSIDASTEKELTVLPSRPTNECYTLLNGLDLLTDNPRVGDELDFSVDKISNYANAYHSLSSVDTDLTISVYNDADLVYSASIEAAANPNVYDSTEVFFSYTPQTAGDLMIQVGGIAQCPVAKNNNEFISLNFNVDEAPVYDVTFNVLDEDGDVVVDANVSMSGVTVQTDADGSAIIGVEEGQYSYEVVHSDFYSFSNTMYVDTPRSEYVTLSAVLIPACSDYADNDGDGLIDLDDPGCADADDNDESDATSQCQDGLDNDGDGLVDYPEDIGCDSLLDNDEYNDVVVLTACEDGIDNDGDGFIDLADSGCDDLTDDNEYNDIAMDLDFTVTPVSGMTPLDIEIVCSLDGGNGDVHGEISINDGGEGEGYGAYDSELLYSTTLTTGVYWVTCTYEDSEEDVVSETIEVVVYGPVCEDGLDNDNDMLIDMADPGCLNPGSDTEENDAFDLSIDGGYLVYPAMDDSDVLVRFKTHNTLGYAIPVVTHVTLNGNDLAVGPFAYDDLIRDQGFNLGMLSAGTYDVSFVVDSTDAYAETDENNTYTFVFVVGETVYACGDGIDNDADGFVDFPEDPGCDSLLDDDEAHVDFGDLGLGSVDLLIDGSYFSVTDGDSVVIDPIDTITVFTDVVNTYSYLNFDVVEVRVDGGSVSQSVGAVSTVEFVHSVGGFLSPGEHTIDIVLNNSYDQTGMIENGGSISILIYVNTPACQDGFDNDGDGLVDLADPGCDDAMDNDESHEDVGSLDFTRIELLQYTGGEILTEVQSDQKVTLYENETHVRIDTYVQNTYDYRSFYDVAVEVEIQSLNFSVIDVDELIPGEEDVYSINIGSALELGTHEVIITRYLATNGSVIESEDEFSFFIEVLEVPVVVLAECEDGLDNDGDGFVDLADLGCDNSSDDDEYNEVVVDLPVDVNLNTTYTTGVAPLTTQSYCDVSNGDAPFTIYWSVSYDSTVVYNSQRTMNAVGVDVEAFTFAQPGTYEIECTAVDSDLDSDSDVSIVVVSELFVPECADGLDNDGDGLSDLADPGCSDSSDDDESDGTSACQDGLDNDGDGFVDMQDVGCLDEQDDDEFNTNDFLTVQGSPGTIAYVANPYEYVFSILSSRDAVTYELVQGPPGMNLDSDGKIYWMPLPHDIGKNSVTVTINNGVEERTVSWTITVLSKAPEAETLREQLGINRITFPEGDSVSRGNSLPITLHLDNYGDFDLEDVRVTVSNLELGIRSRIGPFDLDEGDEMSRTVYVDIPTYAQSGWYDLRITVANDELHRTKHRDIWVD